MILQEVFFPVMLALIAAAYATVRAIEVGGSGRAAPGRESPGLTDAVEKVFLDRRPLLKWLAAMQPSKRRASYSSPP